jgi:hypothetical protein
MAQKAMKVSSLGFTQRFSSFLLYRISDALIDDPKEIWD